MRHQQPQVGMALIPETPVEFTPLQPSNSWMTPLPTTDFQVYAVLDLPEPPALDLSTLSGKKSSVLSAPKPSKDVPQLPEFASPAANNYLEPKAPHVDDSVVLDQDAFALYFDSPATVSDEPSCIEGPLDGELSDEESMARLNRLCSDLDGICDRLAALTPYMDWDVTGCRI